MARLLRLLLLSLLLSLTFPAVAEAVSPNDLTTHKELLQQKLDSQRELAQKDAEAAKARIDALEKRIDDQGNRFSDISSSVDQLGFILTMLFALGGFIGYFSVTAKAKEEANQAAEAVSKKWFEEKSKTLNIKIRELEDLIEDTRQKVDILLSDTEKRVSITEKRVDIITEKLQQGISSTNSLPTNISPESEKELQQSVEHIKEKPEANYSFKDWNTRAFAAYQSGQYEDAAFYWKRASERPNTAAVNKVQALLNRATTFGQLKRYEEACITNEQLITQYSPTGNPFIREQVAQAMLNMGVIHGKMQKPNEAIAIFQRIIDNYSSDDNPAIREQVVKAMLNMGIALERMGKPNETAIIKQRLIDTYSSDDTPAIRELMADPFNGKGFEQLIQAKQLWQDKTQAMALLDKAEASLQESRSRDDSQGFTLGNLAYVQWLLGENTDGEASFRIALASPNNGGEALYQATLVDIAMHPIPEDEGFRAMVERLWSEHQHQTTSQTHASTYAQKEATVTL